jgi:hypothetical protein
LPVREKSQCNNPFGVFQVHHIRYTNGCQEVIQSRQCQFELDNP